MAVTDKEQQGGGYTFILTVDEKLKNQIERHARKMNMSPETWIVEHLKVGVMANDIMQGLRGMNLPFGRMMGGGMLQPPMDDEPGRENDEEDED